MIVLRHPARAVRLKTALEGAGFTPFALPLTDTELPGDTAAVHRELAALARGAYSWLVVTSGNTVQALELIAREAGTTLADVVRAGSARVVAVGSATAELLGGVGVDVVLVPDDESATGILAVFPRGTGDVLLPQSDLAPEDLRAGLARLGWSVRRVEAYRTVASPADPERRVPGVEETGARPPLLGVPAALELLSGTARPIVVFTAPSAVRHFRARLTGGPADVGPGTFAAVAIGRTTAAALRAEGWGPAATAADPSPEGIAAAVRDAAARTTTTDYRPNGDRS